MTPAKLASYIRWRTKTNSNNFSDADMLKLINIEMDDLSARIAQVYEGYFGVPDLRDLVAGVREYPLPEDLLNHIYGIEAKLDGSNWKWLKEFDLNTYQRATDESTILAQFAGLDPMYDLFRGSAFIYSDMAIIGVTEGLKLWYSAYPKHLTALTGDAVDICTPPSAEENGFPRQFHKILGKKVSVAFKQANNLKLTKDEDETVLEKDIQKALEAIGSMNADRSIIASVPYEDGVDY